MNNTKRRHHHYGAPEIKDSADLFRKQSFGAIKRRKLLAKVLFYALLFIAIAIVLGVYYVYTAD